MARKYNTVKKQMERIKKDGGKIILGTTKTGKNGKRCGKVVTVPANITDFYDFFKNNQHGFEKKLLIKFCELARIKRVKANTQLTAKEQQRRDNNYRNGRSFFLPGDFLFPSNPSD